MTVAWYSEIWSYSLLNQVQFQCVLLLASLKGEFSCMDVCCNGSSEHKQEGEEEVQTELLAQFLSKPSNVSPIELNLEDH